ncbi:unnamed protein product, partial [Acidithrix sp. C25]
VAAFTFDHISLLSATNGYADWINSTPKRAISQPVQTNRGGVVFDNL